MPASGLAAVAAFQQVVLGENIKAVFDVEVDIFDESIARRGFDGSLLLSRHWIL